MQRLDHLNVVRCHPPPLELCRSDDETTDPLPLLCMEFCTGGDLRKTLNNVRNCLGLVQTEVLACVGDIASALGKSQVSLFRRNI